MVWPSVTATRCTDAEIAKGAMLEGAVGEAAQDAPRLGLDLLLLAAADVRDHVVGDVQRGDAGVAGAGERLQRHHRRPTRAPNARSSGARAMARPTTLQLGLVTM